MSTGLKGPPPTAGWHYPASNGKAAPTGSIRVQFDRFLAPDTANRQAFCVSNGTDACLAAGSGGGAVTFAVEYDPVDRVVVLKPQKPLDPGLYKVRVLAPKNDADTTGIRAFDGVPMAQETSFDFTVDAGTTAVAGCPLESPSPSCEPKRTVDYCSSLGTACSCSTGVAASMVNPVGNNVADYMHGNCASDSSCHSPSTPPKTGRVGQALMLDDGPDNGGTPGAILRILKLGLVAPETATDPDPGVARVAETNTFARNMPYIDPKNPGNSYILYKMIIGMLRCPFDVEDPARNALSDPSNCQDDGGYQGPFTTFSADYYTCASLAGGVCPGGDVDGGVADVDGGAATGTPKLLHKQGEPLPYLAEPWVPDGAWKPPIAGEYDRLRYRIRGNPMRSPGGGEGPQDIHMVSAWIAAGAPVTATCPAAPAVQ